MLLPTPLAPWMVQTAPGGSCSAMPPTIGAGRPGGWKATPSSSSPAGAAGSRGSGSGAASCRITRRSRPQAATPPAQLSQPFISWEKGCSAFAIRK